MMPVWDSQRKETGMSRAIKELSVEQAAEILNASQEYLQKLLDEG